MDAFTIPGGRCVSRSTEPGLRCTRQLATKPDIPHLLGSLVFVQQQTMDPDLGTSAYLIFIGGAGCADHHLRQVDPAWSAIRAQFLKTGCTSAVCTSTFAPTTMTTIPPCKTKHLAEIDLLLRSPSPRTVRAYSNFNLSKIPNPRRPGASGHHLDPNHAYA
ncbi:uncharacterized protein MYCGRDRAFT_97996 [Zymoseptoria tritici IPO323]|uniref:Uncharacterized protein n=1 Tax=Zymoseptoria tritici (strain CBS 115943 / IPO323) TaxID=336722 RepID=F9XS06_ZYMTI|nr:uncharacterized protein MYCGRDRAFT_97996 [Zymoseptoria tritici IPO323]EGP81887.1 hypothetical protein MYCGRDRAFT_97996 [Zymoseptoria tritici IPO323]